MCNLIITLNFIFLYNWENFNRDFNILGKYFTQFINLIIKLTIYYYYNKQC